MCFPSFNFRNTSSICDRFVDQSRTSIGESLTKPELGLQHVPLEIFAQICSNLEPIWLWNLSHVCNSTHDRLSFQQGNLIWYNAVPNTLWKVAEQFQDERELRELMFSNVRKESYQFLIKPRLDSRPTRVPFSHPVLYGGSSISRLPTSLQGPAPLAQLPTRVVDPSWGYDLSPTRTVSLTTSVWGTGANPSRNRMEVKALGTGYQAIFNYKREVLGHFQTNFRCYICLSIKNDLDSEIHLRLWGLLWCSSCLNKYTVSSTTILTLPNAQKLMQAAIMTCYRTRSGTKMFYLPEIDDLVRQQTGLDIRAHALVAKQCKHSLEVFRVQRSKLESRRRDIRLKIIAFAQKIWDGEDPDPDRVSENGVIHLKSRVHLTSPDTYRVFRERFAPTSHLSRFLFSEHLTSDRPQEATYNYCGGWLEDPTKSLPRCTTVDVLSSRWLSDTAESMIALLTSVFDSRFRLKGFGGFVGEWVKAAKHYHIERLEGEVECGMTVAMAHKSSNEYSYEDSQRIRKLRAKCGLQEEGQLLMTALPSRIEVHDFSNQLSLNDYMMADHAAAIAIRDWKKKIDDFNKIIKKTCVICPNTGGLYFPMGIEGLVNHMLTFHDAIFWLSDDFHVVG